MSVTNGNRKPSDGAPTSISSIPLTEVAAPTPKDASIGDLVRDATAQVSTLFRAEVELAKAEVTGEVKKGLQGSLLTMINLGFSTAGLFFIAGFLYTRQQTTQLPAFGGMAKHTPLLAAFFLLIGLASIGLPGTNGFVGEFLILLGAFKAHWMYGSFAVLGVIFGAAYFLWYYERAILGPVGKAVRETIGDLHLREMVIAVALSVMILWIGLYPAPFLRMMNGSVQALVDRLDHGTVASHQSLGVGREALGEHAVQSVHASPEPPHPSPLTPHGL